MTVPLEVDFWNMPPDPLIEAAAQTEAHSLEGDNYITSCRVRVSPCENSYAVQIVILAGPTMLRFEGDSLCSRILHRVNAFCSKKTEADTAELALHRGFAKIHAQFRQSFLREVKQTLRKSISATTAA